MPNSSYRRKLRTQTETSTSCSVPLNGLTHYVPLAQPSIQPSTLQNCTTKFDGIIDDMHQALDVLIDLTDFSDVKTRCTQLITTLAPYSEYFIILDKIETHIHTIARYTIEPIDISVIKEEIQRVRDTIHTLPSICPDNNAIATRISDLITFIQKTVNLDTFTYSLKTTLETIQPLIDTITTTDQRLDEIYRVIEEIIQNVKDGRPPNVIQWRVRYVRRLVNALVTGNEELTWAI